MDCYDLLPQWYGMHGNYGVIAFILLIICFFITAANRSARQYLATAVLFIALLFGALLEGHEPRASCTASTINQVVFILPALLFLYLLASATLRRPNKR